MPAAAGGWNQPAPPGVPRCSCRTRLFYWAHLDRRAGQPCCHRPCCSAPRAALTVTREGLRALRDEVGDWPCPRCGQPIALHRRNYECVDHITRAIRAYRIRYRR